MDNKKDKISCALGIDIAKSSFRAALVTKEEPEKAREKNFANTPSGHRRFLMWLKGYASLSSIHGCMEATGSYGERLAYRLEKELGKISVENARRIKGYAACRMMRSKSDPADARLIAHYCATQEPRAWQPAGEQQRYIRALCRRIETLKEQLQAEKNRLGQSSESFVQKDLRAHIAFLNRHIVKLEEELLKSIKSHQKLSKQHELLLSLKGIGERSAALILAELPELGELQSARQLAAYAGVTPRHRQSGNSGSSYTPMSKAGSSRLRKILFFPAMSAMRFNPICQSFAQRLKEKGKPSIVVVGAVMTKLLHLIYGILKSEKPFDPCYLNNAKK